MYFKIPAKALLFGEYSVLYEGKALVYLLPNLFFEIEIDVVHYQKSTPDLNDTFISVKSDFFENGLHEFTISSRKDLARNTAHSFFEKIFFPWRSELKNYHVKITIHKSFPPDLGFGSSSAIIAAISYALFYFIYNKKPKIKNEHLWQKIRESLKHAQGIASGYDVGVQLLSIINNNDTTNNINENTFWIYQNQKNSVAPKIKRFVSLSNPDTVKTFGCFIKTNIYSDTTKALKKFSQLNDKEKKFFADGHKKITERFLKSLDCATLVSCMDQSIDLAKQQGIYVDTTLAKKLTAHHIPFKTMGSGLGDCLWVASDKKTLLNLKIVNEHDVIFEYKTSMRSILFNLPPKLLKLQNKLMSLRQKQKLLLQNGDVGIASAPSNIAFIKYWGKSLTDFQIPDNPSLSFTLENFRSNTKITVLGRFFPENETPNFVPPHKLFLTDPQTKESNQNLISHVSEKLNTFLANILSPFALDIGLQIESYNNFPTACGLASSASGMAALCLAIANLLNLEKHFSKSELQYWLAQWSRLGSGSAARSVCLEKNSKFVAWELESKIRNIPYHKNWNQLKHCVFVLNSKAKEITSSTGHLLAHTSPLHEIRVNSVKTHFDKFKKAIKNFDFEYVASATENDAFAMHAVMQTSTPPAIYLNKEVSFVISEFIKFRKKENIKAFWTLDAGPNVHFLYLAPYKRKMLKFYKSLNLPIKIYE